MKTLIVASGKIDDLGLLETLLRESDFIVCADGGLDHLRKVDAIPDLVLGDLDSISQEGLRYIGDKKISLEKFPKMKDETDTELAIRYLIENAYDNITLTGVTGSRMDHTMANIFLLKDLKKRGISSKIVDDNNSIYFEDSRMEFKKTDEYISIVPLKEDGIVISLEGFLYPLSKKQIDFGSTMCISNRIVEDLGIIEIHSGEALIFKSRD